MTAKEKQSAFIKTFLKPLLKQNGYINSRQTWWKSRGEFYTVINLQNFSWNSKDDVCFCFNTGIALNTMVKNISKPTIHDCTVYIRSGFYLPEPRQTHLYLNETGYQIQTSTELDLFTAYLKADLEHYIIPQLEQLNTLGDCVKCYRAVPFWGDRLKTVIEESRIVL